MKNNKPRILRSGDPDKPWVVEINGERVGYIKARFIYEAITLDGATIDQHFNGRTPAADFLVALHEKTGHWYIGLTIPNAQKTLYLSSTDPTRWQPDRKICKQFKSNKSARHYARIHLHQNDLSGGQLSYEWSST